MKNQNYLALDEVAFPRGLVRTSDWMLGVHLEGARYRQAHAVLLQSAGHLAFAQRSRTHHITSETSSLFLMFYSNIFDLGMAYPATTMS